MLDQSKYILPSLFWKLFRESIQFAGTKNYLTREPTGLFFFFYCFPPHFKSLMNTCSEEFSFPPDTLRGNKCNHLTRNPICGLEVHFPNGLLRHPQRICCWGLEQTFWPNAPQRHNLSSHKCTPLAQWAATWRYWAELRGAASQPAFLSCTASSSVLQPRASSWETPGPPRKTRGPGWTQVDLSLRKAPAQPCHPSPSPKWEGKPSGL